MWCSVGHNRFRDSKSHVCAGAGQIRGWAAAGGCRASESRFRRGGDSECEHRGRSTRADAAVLADVRIDCTSKRGGDAFLSNTRSCAGDEPVRRVPSGALRARLGSSGANALRKHSRSGWLVQRGTWAGTPGIARPATACRKGSPESHCSPDRPETLIAWKTRRPLRPFAGRGSSTR